MNNMNGNAPFMNMVNGNNINNIPMQSAMSSSSITVPPQASSSALSAKKQLLLQESNQQLNEEQLKLQAKIRKEMLATEEMLINTYIEGDNYETTHFILEKMGISIPIKYFFVT